MSDLERAAHLLVCREAAPADIDLLAARAGAGADVLSMTLEMARHDAQARQELEAQLAGAERVELPAQPAGGRRDVPVAHLRRLSAAAPGWLAATAVAVVWWLAPAPGGGGPGATPVSYTVDEALDRYLEAGALQGRVLGELPALMVESRQLETGAEIVYVRRVLERAVVDGIVEHDVDDAGRLVERAVSPATFARPEEL